MYNELWATFLTAFVLSLACTPLAMKLAPKIGAMDVPKDGRRMHTKAMPRYRYILRNDGFYGGLFEL